MLKIVRLSTASKTRQISVNQKKKMH